MKVEGWIKADHVGPREGRAVRTPWDELVTRKVAGQQTGGAFSLFEVEVTPRGGQPPHVQHREDEFFYVIEGRFGFLVEDGEEFEAGPGSLVYVPKGNLHAFENAGETTGRLLVGQTPAGSYERFLEEAGKPATEESPDAEGLAAIAVEYGIEMVSPHPWRAPG